MVFRFIPIHSGYQYIHTYIWGTYQCCQLESWNLIDLASPPTLELTLELTRVGLGIILFWNGKVHKAFRAAIIFIHSSSRSPLLPTNLLLFVGAKANSRVDLLTLELATLELVTLPWTHVSKPSSSHQESSKSLFISEQHSKSLQPVSAIDPKHHIAETSRDYFGRSVSHQLA